jgi:hypothetical protein
MGIFFEGCHKIMPEALSTTIYFNYYYLFQTLHKHQAGLRVKKRGIAGMNRVPLRTTIISNHGRRV